MEGTAYKVWQTRSVSKGKTVGLIKLLDELEKVVAKGVALPFFSPGLVDRDRCLELIDLMRASLPEEVMSAQRIIAGEEEIRQRAEREAALMVEESQLTKMAEIRSQNIIQEGEKGAERIVEAAENQAYRILLKLEHTLDLLKAEAKEAMAAGFHPGSSEG